MLWLKKKKIRIIVFNTIHCVQLFILGIKYKCTFSIKYEYVWLTYS